MGRQCRQCGSRGRHARGCKHYRCVSAVPVVRREKAPKPVTRIDDEFLVILALRMAAYHTLRDDLKPQYLRIAEEREAQRMQALAGQGMTAQQVEAADRLTQASYSNEQVSQVCWQELVDLHTLADMVLAKYQVRTSPSAK